MEEIHQQRYLASELKIRREDFTDFGDIHAVRLGSVDLALPLLNGRMQTHSRQMLRKFPFIGTTLAEIKESFAVHLHIVDIAYACHSTGFVNVVDCELKGYWLHESVFATFLDMRARKS